MFTIHCGISSIMGLNKSPIAFRDFDWSLIESQCGKAKSISIPSQLSFLKKNLQVLLQIALDWDERWNKALKKYCKNFKSPQKAF